MRISSLHGLAAECTYLIRLWPIVTSLVRLTQGVAYTPVQSPDLALDGLGRVALTGNFDSISLYKYQQQSEGVFSTNGTQSLISQLPNGDFVNAANADGYIKALCPFVMQGGKLAGIIVGGNFTSFGGVQAQGVALYDPASGKVTPLPGLTGQVNAVLCDEDTNTVYVGGSFKGANSTNAVAWVGMSGWANLPFEGFNGPVNSIVKSTNNSVLFGGSFTGLGNSTMPTKKDQQIINISSANITVGGNSTLPGFNDPTNIVCKTNGQDGPGNTWLMQDHQPGFWSAAMNFGYEPSLLRLWNTRQDGRGTKVFRFTALPLGGIMNFTYTDPDTGKTAYCDARCPLSQDPKIPYQDFRFFNYPIGMSSFRIDVSEWYGAGGGFDGIELFQDDIYAYAESDLNEPACSNTSTPSNSTVTGPWVVSPSLDSYSRYLTADLTSANVVSDNISVIFKPDVKQKGNYSVTMYTPGCLKDNSCQSRGIVNVTGTYATSAAAGIPTATTVAQTNNYDKYDEIYRGPVDVTSDSFRPTVMLMAMTNGQSGTKIVAQRVQFSLTTNSTDGSGLLNGLYEFNPSSGPALTDISNSTIDSAGADLGQGAIITSIAVTNGITYVGGNFTDQAVGFENIFSIGKGNSTSLPSAGLNAQVSNLFAFEDMLYVSGNFTNTQKGDVPGLNNVAGFNTARQSWVALGAGVNGPVNTIVSLEINVTSNVPETCISFNGFFNQTVASGPNKAINVQGFAIWVPSRQNWLQNLGGQSQSVTGLLSASTNVTNSAPLLAGTLQSQDMSSRDVVTLTSGPLRLNQLSAGIQPQSAGSMTRKRALAGQNTTGVVTGLFYNQNSMNITVLGGHFTATGSNGSTIDNLAFIDGKGGITGLTDGIDANSVFLSLATTGTSLYAGGNVTGKVQGSSVNGLVVYDLSAGAYTYPQPPPLQGKSVAVNAITVRPKSSQVYVAGSFDSAGSLGCPSVCYFENGVWNPPSNGIGGVVSALIWQGNDKLLVGGNLTINNNATTLANYDASKSVWSPLAAASNIPGPITALAPADNAATTFWVAGKATNGSVFLMKYDGTSFHVAPNVFGAQTIIQGISVLNLNKDHDDSILVDRSMTLLVTGQLSLPDTGNASAVLFNGTTFTPFILSTAGKQPGSLSTLFSEQQMDFKSSGRHLAIGLVVLIALACALGAIFLLVVTGILIERYRRKQEGYTPAPTTYFDKTSNMGRIPPEHLFGRLGGGRQPPQI